MRTGNEQKRGLPLVAGIAGGIVILVAAVWYVIASMIDSLNENSARLHELHVKPNTAKSMEMSAANEFLGKSDAQRSAKKVDETETESVHKEADRLYGQGCTALKRGDYPTAIDLFTKSHHLMADEMHRGITDVQDDVGIAARFAALGYCYYKVGNYDAAEKELTWAIDVDPDRADYHRQRAFIYRTKGKLKLADRDMKDAERLAQHPFASDKARAFEGMFGTGAPNP